MLEKTQIHTRVLMTLVIGTMLFFILFTFERVFVTRGYTVIGEASCDPAAESCFVYECDPLVEECTGNPEEDTWYYKEVRKRASSIVLCDPSLSEECPELSCSFGEYGCEEIYCDPTVDESLCSEKIEATTEDGQGTEGVEEDEESGETNLESSN